MKNAGILQKVKFLKVGWWIIHVAGIAIAYSLGHLLWR
jgi:hypothetical protein